MPSLDDLENAFLEGEKMYNEILKKNARGAATVQEVDLALEQLKKGSNSSEAGVSPIGKYYKYSTELRQIKRDIQRYSHRPKNNA